MRTVVEVFAFEPDAFAVFVVDDDDDGVVGAGLLAFLEVCDGVEVCGAVAVGGAGAGGDGEADEVVAV